MAAAEKFRPYLHLPGEKRVERLVMPRLVILALTDTPHRGASRFRLHPAFPSGPWLYHGWSPCGFLLLLHNLTML